MVINKTNEVNVRIPPTTEVRHFVFRQAKTKFLVGFLLTFSHEDAVKLGKEIEKCWNAYKQEKGENYEIN